MVSNLHLLHIDGFEGSTASQSTTLSARIVAGVREALAARRRRPGDAPGTENEIAAHWNVSRIAASNPDLFADAFGADLCDASRRR